MLKKNYRPNDDLVIAWWDADWFREMLKDELGWLNEEEIEACMSVADDAVEFSNLADAIVSSCSYEVEKMRLEKNVAGMKQHLAEYRKVEKKRLSKKKKGRVKK